MKTTIELLDELRERFNLPSDYALQEVLGISKQAISRYRKGHGFFDEDVAVRAAELLDLAPGYVLACIAAERTKSAKARKAWQHVAATAAVILLAVNLAPNLAEQGSALAALAAGAAPADSLYIMLNSGPAAAHLPMLAIIPAIMLIMLYIFPKPK